MPSTRLQIGLVLGTCAACALSVSLFGFPVGVTVLVPWSVILFVLAARSRGTFYVTLGVFSLFLYMLFNFLAM